jgi:hypothetical protein
VIAIEMGVVRAHSVSLLSGEPREGSSPRSQPQCTGELAQRRQQFVRATKHLDHDMIGAGPQMLAQALSDVVGAAVGD